MGIFQLLIVIFILMAVIWETFIFYKNNNLNNNFFKRNIWVKYIFYFLAYFLWLVVTVVFILSELTSDDGFGIGIDALILDTVWYKVGAGIIVKIIELVIMMYTTWYLRTKFSKRNDVLIQEFWIDAIKGLIFIAFAYCVVGSLKTVFGRPFYYSTIFDQILEQAKSLGYEYNGSVMWGSGPNGTGAVDYYEWWQTNHFSDNIKYWFSFNSPSYPNNGWWNRDFPSGHTISTLSILAVMFLFINPSKERFLTKQKLFFIYFILFGYLTLMKFSLMLLKVHWPTDLEFSTIYGIFTFYLANLFVDKVFRIFVNKFKVKKLKQNLSADIIYHKNGFELFIQNEKFNSRVGYFLYGKKKEIKIKKTLNKYKVSNYNTDLIEEKKWKPKAK